MRNFFHPVDIITYASIIMLFIAINMGWMGVAVVPLAWLLGMGHIFIRDYDKYQTLSRQEGNPVIQDDLLLDSWHTIHSTEEI